MMASASSSSVVLTPAVPRAARALLAAALVGASAGASAAPFSLVYTGTFDTTESLDLASAGTRTPFTSTVPFTIEATFDSGSPNLLPPAFPFLGFHAYVPSSAMITIEGTTYTIETAATNATAGVAVAVFDRTQIFNNGRYGIGLIANVLADGAGIVGDFAGASPEFTVDALRATTFTNYFGVGHGSGTCIPGTGSPPNCDHFDTPWVLHDSGGATWNLILGNYEEDYPVPHPRPPFPSGSPVGALNTAVITAIPEPASLSLVLAGLAGVGARVRGRRRAA